MKIIRSPLFTTIIFYSLFSPTVTFAMSALNRDSELHALDTSDVSLEQATTIKSLSEVSLKVLLKDLCFWCAEVGFDSFQAFPIDSNRRKDLLCPSSVLLCSDALWITCGDFLLAS